MGKKIAKLIIKVGRLVEILSILAPVVAFYYVYDSFSIENFILFLLSICYAAYLLEEQKRDETFSHYHNVYKEISEKKGWYKEHYDIDAYKRLCDNLFQDEKSDEFK
jgi:hypothetical protein